MDYDNNDYMAMVKDIKEYIFCIEEMENPEHSDNIKVYLYNRVENIAFNLVNQYSQEDLEYCISKYFKNNNIVLELIHK